MDELLPVVLEVGKYNLACMELLDRANTETYGTPEPTTVPLTVEKGPFIVVTGHDYMTCSCCWSKRKGKEFTSIPTGKCFPPTLIRS